MCPSFAATLGALSEKLGDNRCSDARTYGLRSTKKQNAKGSPGKGRPCPMAGCNLWHDPWSKVPSRKQTASHEQAPTMDKCNRHQQSYPCLKPFCCSKRLGAYFERNPFCAVFVWGETKGFPKHWTKLVSVPHPPTPPNDELSFWRGEAKENQTNVLPKRLGTTLHPWKACWEFLKTGASFEETLQSRGFSSWLCGFPGFAQKPGDALQKTHPTRPTSQPDAAWGGAGLPFREPPPRLLLRVVVPKPPHEAGPRKRFLALGFHPRPHTHTVKWTKPFPPLGKKRKGESNQDVLEFIEWNRIGHQHRCLNAGANELRRKHPAGARLWAKFMAPPGTFALPTFPTSKADHLYQPRAHEAHMKPTTKANRSVPKSAWTHPHLCFARSGAMKVLRALDLFEQTLT